MTTISAFMAKMGSGNIDVSLGTCENLFPVATHGHILLVIIKQELILSKFSSNFFIALIFKSNYEPCHRL